MTIGPDQMIKRYHNCMPLQGVRWILAIMLLCCTMQLPPPQLLEGPKMTNLCEFFWQTSKVSHSNALVIVMLCRTKHPPSFLLYLISIEIPAFWLVSFFKKKQLWGERERECTSIWRSSRVVIKLAKREKLVTLG